MGFSLSNLMSGNFLLEEDSEAGFLLDPLDITGADFGRATDEINAQNEAARLRAEALNKERYGIATDLLSPYIEDSGTAREQLMVELGLSEGEAGTAYLNTPGYTTMLDETRKGVDQASANSGYLYSGRRGEAAGEASGRVQQSFYNNYMSLLQNMANPQSATNLASMGLNQGIAMSGQDLNMQQVQSDLYTGLRDDTQARQADIGEGIGNFFTGGAFSGSGYFSGGGGGYI